MRRIAAAVLVVMLSAGALPGADDAIYTQPSDLLNAQLPKWLRFSGEYRARLEGQEHIRWREANSDTYLLSRIRLGVEFRPLSWLRFVGQAQDSHLFFQNHVNPLPPLQSTMDLRMAYVQLGDLAKQPFELRVGRQEITYSEERMIGVSNWGNNGRTFNAIKLRVGAQRLGGMKLDLFASSVVVNKDAVWDYSAPGDNLHGAYAVFDKLLKAGTVEPYYYWRLIPSALDEAGKRGRHDLGLTGLRVTKRLGSNWYFSSDTILQRGHRNTDSVSAWGGYWRARRRLSDNGWKPALVGDVNYATGDRNPRDGRHGTFEVLYPTPHDKYGLADQVGWRNIRHIGGTLEATPRKSLAGQLRFHTWWLDSVTDGLYTVGGALALRDPTGRSGRHVGEEVDLQLIWTPSRSTQLGTGIGHIFNAEFLNRMTPGKAYTFYYLSLTRQM